MRPAELLAEGRALHHCVGSYSGSCEAGRRAIYSVRWENQEGVHNAATVAVSLAEKMVTEARTKNNAVIDAFTGRLVRQWAEVQKLNVARYALGI